jgi:membrane-bound metal-dependent hydrolase YbcI (DUF457 family)
MENNKLIQEGDDSMKGTTHTAVGLASTAVVISQVVPDFSYIGMGIALASGFVGSLLPDLDHPKSRAHRLAGPLQFVTRWLSRKGVFGKHRTLTHSIIGSIPILVLSWYLIAELGGNPYVDYIGWGLGVGWVSHLLTDTLTVAGVRFLWPFNNAPFGLRMCASGGFMDETFLPLVMPVVTLLFVFQRLLPSGGLLSFIKSLI